MQKLLVKQLLLTDGYLVLNKKVIKTFGLEIAGMLSLFAEAESMLADKDGYFYQTADTVEDRLGLGRTRQNNAIAKLEDLGVVKKVVKGMPAKRYFKLNYERVAELIFEEESDSEEESVYTEPTNKNEQKQQTSLRENNKQECTKPTNKNEQNQQTCLHKTYKNKELIYKEPIYKELIYKEPSNKDIPSNSKSNESDEQKMSQSKLLEERFNALWKKYPNKKGKANALKAYQKAIEDGTTDEEIANGISMLNKEIEIKRTQDKYIPHGSTWFNQKRWLDEYDIKEPPKHPFSSEYDDLEW